MNSASNYTLENDHGAYTCPSCGKSKVFVRYVNPETNAHLADHVGCCNSVFECGYHFTPTDYFEANKNQKDHPNAVEFTLSIVKSDIVEKQRDLDYDEDEINDHSDIGEIIPVIEIRNCVLAAKGDISIIGGLPKVGKTSVCSFILSTAFMKNIPAGFDTLGIRTAFCEGKKVIYIDTEQPKVYTNKLRKSVLRILDVKVQPTNLLIYNLRKYDSETKLQKVLGMMKKYPDAHLWIIDGVADLIKDPNDTKESFGIIEKFMIKSNELDTAIILHIHENPGTNGKLRGNLGSEAERKCGGAITIKKLKDKGVHSIEAKVIRGQEDFDPIFFRFEKASGRMVSVDETEAAELNRSMDKGQIKLDKRIQLAKRCLLTGSLKWSDMVEAIMLHISEIEGKPVSKRTAENRIEELVKMGIVHLQNQFYAIADIYKPQP